MKKLIILLVSIFFAFLCFAETQDIYSFSAKNLKGEEQDLKQYQGKTLLIVNLTLHCGTTSQFGDLEKLYQKYKDKDFLVIGFYSNDFTTLKITDKIEIETRCRDNYQLTFPIFTFLEISNKDNPFFQFILSKLPEEQQGQIMFNLEKFLINKEGKVISRFGSFSSPLSRKITTAIEEIL